MKRQLRFHADNDARRILLLSLFLLFGIGLGFFLAGSLPEHDTELLREYVLSRQVALSTGRLACHALETLWLYFRTLLLLLLFGCGAAAVIPILMLCMAGSCWLSFSVGAFAAALGSDGLRLALGMLGFRCLFILPVLLYLSGAAIKAALEPTADNRRIYWRRVLYSAAYLLLGAMLELIVSPLLLRYFFSY